MHFSPSAKYLAYAHGAAKTATWHVYVRESGGLNEPLDEGTWHDVTSHVTDLPDISTNIEDNYGQFTADNLTLEGKGIGYWKTLLAADKLELKVQMVLGLSPDAASDVVVCFSGWVDRAGAEYEELTDTVRFDVYTADELGNRIAGESISTQYIATDIDGDGMEGLAFSTIPGFFVVDANISSYVLMVGVYRIDYEYLSGHNMYRARLNNGAWVQLVAGANTLGNGAASAQDTGRLGVYVTALADLPQHDKPVTEKIVVVQSGQTLPNQWYRFISVRNILGKIYNQLGIDDVEYDTLEIPTAEGEIRVSYLDKPPADIAITGPGSAMCAVGTELWLAIGHRIYSRDMTTGEYTLQVELSSGDVVSKLMVGSSDNHLWILYGDSHEEAWTTLRRYIINTTTLSDAIDVTGCGWYNMVLVDHPATEYVLLYVDATAKSIKRVDGSTLAVTTLFSQGDLGFAGANGPADAFAYLGDVLVVSTNRGAYRFLVRTTITYMHQIHWTGSAWTHDGAIITWDALVQPYKHAAYSPEDDRIYFYMRFGGLTFIASHPYNGNTITYLVATGPISPFQSPPAPDHVVDFLYAGNDTVYCTVRYGAFNGIIYEIAANTATAVHPGNPRIFTQYAVLTWLNDRLYGMDDLGKLFMLADVVSLHVPIADFEGKTVRAALNDVLKGFNLVATIGRTKRARVMLRADESGDLKSGTDTLAVTITEATAIEEIVEHTPAMDHVEVSNGVVTWSFDGTNYNSTVISTARKLSVTSNLIPDEIVKDVCRYLWEYANTARNLYTVSLGDLPLYNYEELDKLSLTLTTTKIQKTGSGPIYGVTLVRPASMEVKALL